MGAKPKRRGDKRLDDHHDRGGPHPRVNEAESPLAWLARRAGPGGARFLSAEQVAAGERLREQFTRAGLMPRMTADWSRVGSGGSPGEFTDAVLAARQNVHRALEAVGPELSGILLDVYCFLKGMEEVERTRVWPQRTAKVVLKLALERLARHYGLIAPARRASGPARHWGTDDYRPGMEGDDASIRQD